MGRCTLHCAALGVALVCLPWASATRAAEPPAEAHGEVAAAADASHAEAAHSDAAHSDAGHGDAEHSDAAHAEADHGDASHGAAPNPLRFKADLAIWTFAVFVLLFLVLAKFAWGPISQGLEHREHHIAGHIASAEKAHRDAQELLAAYDKRLSGVQDEVRAILDEARRDAEHTQQEILKKAQADAHAFKDRALREIDTATSQALRELADKSANLAVDLAGKIVKTRLSPADHAGLIADAVAKLPTNGRN